MKKLLHFLILAFSVSTFAQSPTFNWVQQQGSSSEDLASNITIDNNGNVFTAVSASNSNLMLITKYDANGVLLWTKTIGATPADITIDSFGNVFVIGTFKNLVDFDPSTAVSNLGYVNSQSLIFKFILKLENNGNFVYAKQIGGTPTSIAIDSNQNIYLTGNFKLSEDFDPSPTVSNIFTSIDGYSIFITKLDSTASFVWNKILGKTTPYNGNSFPYCSGNKILIDAVNNVLVAGYFSGAVDFDPGVGETSYGSNLTNQYTQNPFTLKLDNAGDFIWAKYFQASQNSESEDMTLDASGNIYTTGTIQGQMDFDSSANTLYLFHQYQKVPYVSKMDSNGNIIWAKQIFTTEWGCDLNRIKIDNNGNIFTLGSFKNTLNYTTPSGSGTATTAGFQIQNIFVSVLNSAGNLISFNHLGGSDFTSPIDLQLKDNNIYFSGHFRSVVDFDVSANTYNLTSAGNTDSFVSKYSISSFLETKSFSKSEFKIYPNPATNQLNFSFENNLKSAKLKIISTLGQTVYEKSNISGDKISLDVSELSKGIYIIQILNNNSLLTSKFIKE
jgi:hypothetical protein